MEKMFQPNLPEANTLLACLLPDSPESSWSNPDTELSETKRTCALQIIRNGANIHQVRKKTGETFLHLAIKRFFYDVVKLLIEKGIDINAQDNDGFTALHLSTSETVGDENRNELMPMLLYYGADPWLCDHFGDTPFDAFLRDTDFKEDTFIALEQLFYYMFSENEKFEIPVDTLLEGTIAKAPFFQEMIENVDVLFTDCDTATALKLFTMPPDYLETLIEKLEWVVEDVLLETEDSGYYYWIHSIKSENIYLLLSGKLQSECVDWLLRCGSEAHFISVILSSHMPASSKENLVLYLIFCGMTATKRDLEAVRQSCGYKKLFKVLLHMDLLELPYPFRMTDPMTLILYDVGGDVQEGIKDPRFWFTYDWDDRNVYIKDLLPYYALPYVKDCRYALELEDDVVKKLCDQPRVPLLTELARNASRKYLAEKFEIKNAKQFYNLVNSLSISKYYKKMLTLEVPLY